MNTFQESLSSRHLAVEIAASVRTRWGHRSRFKGRLSRWSPLSRSNFVRALPAESPLPANRCGNCQYFRGDPAWVAGVFSGPAAGLGYAAACAADGVCRRSHRLRSGAFTCAGFVAEA